MNTDTGKVYDTDESITAASARGEPLVELPGKPNPNCPTCHGRGTGRSWGQGTRYGACPICYPNHQQKALTFKQRLAQIQRGRAATPLNTTGEAALPARKDA